MDYIRENGKKVRYIGETTLTCGDHGETVESGFEIDGAVWVWDSTFGWFFWGDVCGNWEYE